MLPLSVATFRRAFGSYARYVVATDEPAEIKLLLGDAAEVIAQVESGANPFALDVSATWRKWCPRVRLSPHSTEIFVDADVFLVGNPVELKQFCHEASPHSFLILQEAVGSPYYVGNFRSRILRGIPPVNIGLLGQRAGTDITADLLSEFRWWLEHVPEAERKYHDDQGAIVTILARAYLIGLVQLLPQSRYAIVNHRSNSHLTTLDGIVAIHATMGHSAFRRFQREITTFATATRSIEQDYAM